MEVGGSIEFLIVWNVNFAKASIQIRKLLYQIRNGLFWSFYVDCIKHWTSHFIIFIIQPESIFQLLAPKWKLIYLRITWSTLGWKRVTFGIWPCEQMRIAASAIMGLIYSNPFLKVARNFWQFIAYVSTDVRNIRFVKALSVLTAFQFTICVMYYTFFN